MSVLQGPPSTWQRSWDLAWLALAIVWLGGLTFYAAVVVPLGAEVTDQTTQGFITQRVTVRLNALGTLYLIVTATDAVRCRAVAGRSRQVLWWILAATQASLWILHPVLERMLDLPTRSIHDSAEFYDWHRLYLTATTVQWAAAVGHVWATSRHSRR